ncbi:MAG: hypothetical protein ACJAVK_000850 [Akkermansiaceae bacterium]|jgi:hypothetical protein
MIGKSSVYHLKDPEGALLINLRKFPQGANKALSFLSDGTPGVYAWFRAFDFGDEPEAFYEELMREIHAPKFAPRSGFVAPYYNVEIASAGQLPTGKQKALRIALEDETFRTQLQNNLSLGYLFQAPLYIGKSHNLKTRLSNHLKEESPLRLRLEEASVDIDKCLLFVSPQYDQGLGELIPDDKEASGTAHNEEEMEDFGEPATELDHELLIEEVLSRLFSPQFTLRIG